MEEIAGKLVLSGVVGGFVVSAVTIIGERYGGRVGGFVGGLPSAVMVIYLFIGWVQGPRAAHPATTGFPLAYAIGVFCVFLYILRRNGNLVSATLSFFGLWLILQTAVVLSDFRSYPVVIAIAVVFLAFLLIYLRVNGPDIARRVPARECGR